jgi:hypothetical protein
MIPDNPEALLRRDEAAKALSAAGFPTSPSTLASKASRGGGPPFRLYGRIPVYRWGDTLTWARNRLSTLRDVRAGEVISDKHKLNGGSSVTTNETAKASV